MSPNTAVTIYNSVLVLSGFGLIGFATWYTKNANCLWAIILLVFMLKGTK